MRQRIIRCVVGARARLTGDVEGEFYDVLRKRFEYKNPNFAKLKKMRLPAWREPAMYATWRQEDDGITIPRGGLKFLRNAAKEHGYTVEFVDERTAGKALPESVESTVALRPYQEAAVHAGIASQNCLITSPTGSGKTTICLAMIARAGRCTLVIVDSGELVREWQRRAMDELSLREGDVGFIGDGKFKIAPVTIALNQAINAIRKEAKWRAIQDAFGMVLCDEVQTFAARTFSSTIDRLPSKYRIGVSDDYRRPDRKDFLITDQFGGVAYAVNEDELIEQGAVVDVPVILMPTDFKAPWYRRPGLPVTGKSARLLDEMAQDDDRTEACVNRIVAEVAAGHRFLVFAARNEHCRVVKAMLESHGVPAGLMIGEDHAAFERTHAGLGAGTVKVGVGNLKSLGKGVNLPAVDRGFVMAPVATSLQPWRQVKGRICRPKEGGGDAAIWYAWDWMVHGKKVARNLARWSRRCDVWTPGGMIPVNQYLKEME